MNAIHYKELHHHLTKIMDRVCETHEPLIITRKSGRNTVLLSYEDYSAIQETFYLLSSPKMAARLRESLDSFRRGTGVERTLEEI